MFTKVNSIKVLVRVHSAYSHSHVICLHKIMLCATSNNCYIDKAREILVLIAHMQMSLITANTDVSKVDICMLSCIGV